MDFRNCVSYKIKEKKNELKCVKITSGVIDTDSFITNNMKLCPFKDKTSVEIWQYCFERILCTFKKKDFEAYLRNGWYGKELSKIDLVQEKELILQNFFKLKDKNEMINYCLMIEYNYLLDCLKNTKWNVKIIPINKILVGNIFRKLKPKRLDFYKEKLTENTICGIYFEENDQYHLCDGYHRLQTAKNKNFKTIKAIVFKKEK